MEKSLEEVLRELESMLLKKEQKQISKEVSQKYLSSFSGGEPVLKKKKEILSYASIRMRATYEATKFVLNKIDEDEFVSALDVGAGTGAATIALLEKFKIKSVDAVELEQEMIKLSQKIISQLNFNSSVNYIKADATKFNIEKQYDIIIASYFLNELKKEDRLELVLRLFEKTNKYLIIVEPGTPKNHQEMMEIRDVLEENGAMLLSPCKATKCPALGSDWCHFLARVNRSHVQKELKGAALNYEDEKFTFLIFRKGEKRTPIFENIIIRRPQQGKGLVKIKACTRNGVETKIITKSDKERYKLVKKLGVGDEF